MWFRTHASSMHWRERGSHKRVITHAKQHQQPHPSNNVKISTINGDSVIAALLRGVHGGGEEHGFLAAALARFGWRLAA